MIHSVRCGALSCALEKLKDIVRANKKAGISTVIFCEDRLSLAAERTVCAAVEGSFDVAVYTFARFLSAECGKPVNLLTSQGSAMAIRKIIEENREGLSLFKKLSAPAAAGAVYDAISMLFASRAGYEEVERAASEGGILGLKLKDIALIYKKYLEYLAENRLEDRNGYLKKLADVVLKSDKIKGSSVVFLGFQALTPVAMECAVSTFEKARDVWGLFTGGKEDIYVNEAGAAFAAAAEKYGGAKESYVNPEGRPEPEELRKRLFNPESLHMPPLKTGRVKVIEAADEDGEFEFIAANIKRHVTENGERYAKISVMLPDLASCAKKLTRKLDEYRIPYYVDRRIPLAEHPLCAFIFSFLSCVISGCRARDVESVISSPYFKAERADKYAFINYMLRLANYRGGVKREPKKEVLDSMGFDYAAVQRVRQSFLAGLALISRGGAKGAVSGIAGLFKLYGVSQKAEEIAEAFKDSYPAPSELNQKAPEKILKVVAEAETFIGGLDLKDTIKILKSGFTAAEISLIPPKADRVFVGDIVSTVNTGSNVVFAARLTGEVPDASDDTSLLTDRDIAALSRINLNISPKIRQVNARKREIVALNMCAFREYLYLSYPVRSGGEENSQSEIITYAKAAFGTESVQAAALERNPRLIPSYASEKLPALKQLVKNKSGYPAPSIYRLLAESGFKAEADAALKMPRKRAISCGRRLYLNYDSISPTALETYFTCPYLAFMRQGLRVKERDEETVRSLDTGNLVHAVLEKLAAEVNGIPDVAALDKRAAEICEELLKNPPYSAISELKSGIYTISELKTEIKKIAEGMYEQLKNSDFKVAHAEYKCSIKLDGGVKLFGRIDRVDECGDMVRIIDYKTGSVDADASLYYTGAKLQLPLYLSAAAEGKRPVGAYYFPASVDYKSEEDGVFRLQGFMDGSEEVVSATDKTLTEGKSAYVEASLSGRRVDSVMPKEEFSAFLQYGKLVAAGGAKEMLGGNITPSPTENACNFCKMGGSCLFTQGKDAKRKPPTVKCKKIAQLVLEGGDGDVDG